jgi:hypothetical protein
MDGRKAFAVTMVSIGLLLAVGTLVVGALRNNWSVAWALIAVPFFLFIEPGVALLFDERTDDKAPPNT